MRILYGIQGTGNGHLTRARCMAKAFKTHGVQVDFLVSGRARHLLTDMAMFGDWRHCTGLSFVTHAGKINVSRTWQQLKLRQFWHDVRTLDLSPYDVVITDFEPVSAWAAKRQHKPCIGISHQNAFLHAVPMQGGNPLVQWIMRFFAPAPIRIGMHWHAFNAPILPPMIDVTHAPCLRSAVPYAGEYVLVYLPFEQPEHVLQVLQQLPQQQFVCFGAYSHIQQLGHITLHPVAREPFLQALQHCSGVVANAGFELSSEALHWGKRILVKPLLGQMEQLSNAKALTQLGLGSVMPQLNAQSIRAWLDKALAVQCIYPNVATHLVQWITAQHYTQTTPHIQQSVQQLSQTLWQQTQQRVFMSSEFYQWLHYPVSFH